MDNSTLDETEKRRRAVDGDNGLWLCATHDKLFEYGKIYFDERGALALNPALTVAQREYVERITPRARDKPRAFDGWHARVFATAQNARRRRGVVGENKIEKVLRKSARRTRVHFCDAKGILSADNGMNIYRGCTHGCIYCDSRSRCYGFTHEFEDVEVKANAVELLETALKRKRKKCMLGTGSMTDPYMPIERRLGNMRRVLETVYR